MPTEDVREEAATEAKNLTIFMGVSMGVLDVSQKKTIVSVGGD